MIAEAAACLKLIDPMAAVLACAVLAGVLLAWRATRNQGSRFNFEDILLDSRTGRTSLSKVGQFIALSVSSWGFVFLTLAGKLSEWYFTTYMLAWAGANVASKWINNQQKGPST